MGMSRIMSQEHISFPDKNIIRGMYFLALKLNKPIDKTVSKSLDIWHTDPLLAIDIMEFFTEYRIYNEKS